MTRHRDYPSEGTVRDDSMDLLRWATSVGLGPVRSMRDVPSKVLRWSRVGTWSTGGPMVSLRTRDGDPLRCERQREEYEMQMAAKERDGR